MAHSNRDMYAGMTTYFVIPPERNNAYDNFYVDVEEITRWTPISPGSMRWSTVTVMNMPAGGTSEEEEINNDNASGGGLSEQEIKNRLKIRNIPFDWKKEESETCAVCLDDLLGCREKEDRKVGILRCGHEYHVDCIGRWLRIKNVCPLCKGSALGDEKATMNDID